MVITMKKRPVIGIIIPVYNVEQYLRRCLDSIVSQTWRNLQIILVDDGSTDNSGRICDEYAGKDRRIQVIHKENGGLSEARNTGIKAASAHYIAFVDSDDYVEKRYVQRLIRILSENDADIAVCGYYQGKRETFKKKKKKQQKIQSFNSQTMLKNWHGKYKHVETVSWNKLYKRSIFVENDICYPAGYFFEDVQTTHLLINKARRIVMTNEKLYYYYQGKDGITHTISEKKIRDGIASQNKRLDFFKRNGYQAACERLTIKRQKQFMLNYFKCVQINGLDNVCAEMIALFHKNYEKVCGFNTIRMWERLLFFMFKYLHDMIRILYGKV